MHGGEQDLGSDSLLTTSLEEAGCTGGEMRRGMVHRVGGVSRCYREKGGVILLKSRERNCKEFTQRL